ncbi:hypothetical protein J2S83_010128, partial [Bradyrhizobium japonicum]|nr:hypothetical protein [Bradyrhizobium japonicum]
RVITRRFVCEVPQCRRRIFAERFGDDILPTRSRRTARLECIVHHLGLALGGRPAASFAKRLMLPVSNDTLLRVVRRRTRPRTEPLIVAGIDDWAFRKNHRYGTIVCDLQRRRIVTLLPDREIATVRAWLSDHPEIRVVSRDRGGGYGEAAAKALPDAVQVADRWHLMENASAAFLNAVRRSMRVIRTAIGATTINPKLLTCAERLQYEGYLRRKQTNAAIMELVRDAVPLKEIVRRTGHRASEALPLQTTPELCAVTAALAPLRIQKGQVGIERALPGPEDICTLAATDLANESVSGQHGDDGPRRRPINNCKKFHPREQSHD